jgi:hypothetical protein
MAKGSDFLGGKFGYFKPEKCIRKDFYDNNGPNLPYFEKRKIQIARLL